MKEHILYTVVFKKKLQKFFFEIGSYVCLRSLIFNDGIDLLS